jgi:hypothetical protein
VASFLSTAVAGGDWKSILISPCIYICIYLAYGIGFLHGLIMN